MGRRKKADAYTAAQIVEILRAVEAAKGEGQTAAKVIWCSGDDASSITSKPGTKRQHGKTTWRGL